MDRTPPTTGNNQIQLYIRTLFSLLRSSSAVRVRSLEDTHIGMDSNLHSLAGSPQIDVSALTYAALRIPSCVSQTKLVLLGQMEEVFARKGYPEVEKWEAVRSPARRRKTFWNASTRTLAAFVASISDIDDLVPCIVSFQIEWNKIFNRLSVNGLKERLNKAAAGEVDPNLHKALQTALSLSDENYDRLQQLWKGKDFFRTLADCAGRSLDIEVSLLGGGLTDYRKAVQTWWKRVEQVGASFDLGNRPVYFISSNVHSIINAVNGFSKDHRAAILQHVRDNNPEGLAEELTKLEAEGDEGKLQNFLYHTARSYITSEKGKALKLQDALLAREAEVGVLRILEPQNIDVEVQLLEVRKLRKEWMDTRIRLTDAQWKALSNSNALLLNIDYPLGMAAYHIFSQISSALSQILGVYVLGKAATLNGRVGDVMIPNVVHDEHSRNTYLFKNCFVAGDVSPWLNFGTVFDNQKAVTVRGTILQNREFMHVFYDEGYTDIEMETGPYLSAIYEHINPKRYPQDEIVNLFLNAPYDIGFIHYASDTPISRKQHLLSKSLGYFGIDSTYACTAAVLQRVLASESRRMGARD